jgi:dTDP-glucose 4,6-dehydratase
MGRSFPSVFYDQLPVPRRFPARQASFSSAMEKTILVTGGSGFIGSNFILQWMAQEGTPVVNLDKLTYAGNPRNLLRVSSDSRYYFAHGEICDRELVRGLLERYRPRAMVHFAAESHVDGSIRGPDDFIHTNVNSTFCLLEEVRPYFAWLTDR